MSLNHFKKREKRFFQTNVVKFQKTIVVVVVVVAVVVAAVVVVVAAAAVGVAVVVTKPRKQIQSVSRI